MDYQYIVGRGNELFADDMALAADELTSLASGSRCLVIGGAGSIGQQVVKELFKRDPKALHVVDLSENNLVEVVRDIRSSQGYGSGDFKTFALDAGSPEFDALINHHGPYDYVFNLSALKHVRSESDPFTLMRLVVVNILNTLKTVRQASEMNAVKYFCVSTDKAANPVNLMGGSKRIMEKVLQREALSQCVSMARFANVAFSDGSLLHGFNQRLLKGQPLSAPIDVRRYFLTPPESGQLCLLSALLGRNGETFFPKLNASLDLTKFSDIAIRYLSSHGYEAYQCDSEEEARTSVEDCRRRGKWPVYFFKSDTTGEKDFEEFYMDGEQIDMDRFSTVGIVKADLSIETHAIDNFLLNIEAIRQRGAWTKDELVAEFKNVLPELIHEEKGKYLDDRM